MKTILVICSALVWLTACERQKVTTEATAQTVYQEAMKIHDELMPRMDEVYTLEGKLKTRRDSLLTDSVTNAQKISIVREKLSALEAASNDMMHWMHNIQDVPGASAPVGHAQHSSGHASASAPKETAPDESLKIQQEQKKQIEKVKAAMEKSIDDAKNALGN
ncbi:hypothetical protein [Chryseolinea lacunae]|uniref:Viral A-type inclusion protein n=1 Tax=Chryseolinea lacunae TaxID=2801331 RepID=A0ABS1KQV5_9BACT|nr:hypothetical protein [Chryseolinea lacunae]MBL0740676.1 hypothetical protein [Chryseolinea lacunae]